jgi:hypothetical protein
MGGGYDLGERTEGEASRSLDHRGGGQVGWGFQREPKPDVFIDPPQLFAPSYRIGQQQADFEKPLPGLCCTMAVDDPEKLIGVGSLDRVDCPLIDH